MATSDFPVPVSEALSERLRSTAKIACSIWCGRSLRSSENMTCARKSRRLVSGLLIAVPISVKSRVMPQLLVWDFPRRPVVPTVNVGTDTAQDHIKPIAELVFGELRLADNHSEIVNTGRVSGVFVFGVRAADCAECRDHS